MRVRQDPVNLIAHSAYMVGLHAQEDDFSFLYGSHVVCSHWNHQLPSQFLGLRLMNLSPTGLVLAQELLVKESSGQNTAQFPQTDDRHVLNNSVSHA